MEVTLFFGRWDDSVLGMAIDNELERAEQDESFRYEYDGIDYPATHAEIGRMVTKWIADNLFIDMEFKGVHYAKDYYTGDLDGFDLEIGDAGLRALDDYLDKWKLWGKYRQLLQDAVKPEEGYMPFYSSVHAIPDTLRTMVKLELVFEKEESFIDQYVIENLEAILKPLAPHNKPLSYFSGTGDPVLGVDYQGSLYCWKCIPLNSNNEMPESFEVQVVYEDTLPEGYCCCKCGSAIDQ